MPSRLKRYQTAGHFHFITFSCYHRLPYLNNDQARITFESTLEQLRTRHKFHIFGYVLMPEHVHLLLSEPNTRSLASTLNVLKAETSKPLKGDRKQFWAGGPPVPWIELMCAPSVRRPYRARVGRRVDRSWKSARKGGPLMRKLHRA